jgi:hypothetical protein
MQKERIMKLSKAEYNENATDVDALEKLRIQQEAETEHKLIVEQEATKRAKISNEEETKRGDNYLWRKNWLALGGVVAIITISIAAYNGYDRYVELERARIHAAEPTPCPKCPEVSCQPVQVK